MELTEITPGLWRWTIDHPGAEDDPEPESPADWPRQVGCVACETEGAMVLIDPLVTDWEPLDDLVADKPTVVLQTVRWHDRSCREAIERYGAATQPPAGVEPILLERSDETMYWLPQHATLVPGDRLLGDGRGGLRLCPASWLGYIDGQVTLDDLKGELQPVLDLPVERVLVSHGEPVLQNGKRALTELLA